MKSPLRKITIVLLYTLLTAGRIQAAEASNIGPELPTVKAAVIVCKGMIDDGLYKSIQRRVKTAFDEGADYLIFEIGTYGGLLKSADDISKYLILDIPQMSNKVHTVAYITTEAISAGAMISVSCQDIIMRENTTIGDCAPIMPGSKLEGVEREKTESFTRAAFARAAEANGYPEPLLKAMVTMQTEVYRVKNLQTGKLEFFETAQLPKDPNTYDLDNKELIVKDDELLTLTASKAFEYGIARATVNDLSEALEFLAKRDGVTFDGEPVMLITNWSEEMVRWLNSPAVMAILVMLALLGVYVEFNTPGLGLPGLAAVICFTIIIGSKYLVGLANWVEVGLFILGILLLLIEFLVLPGFGIAGFSGIVCILAGLFGMLIKNPPDKLPWPEDAIAWSDFTWGVVGLALGFVGFIVMAWLLSKYIPRIKFLSGLILVPTVPKQSGGMPVSTTTVPENETLKVNVGHTGVVVSTLRPTGKARFGEVMVDVVAEAEFLDKGTKVQIIEMHGNRVVVKKFED
ncbi:MAG: NfeD family protein [Phycisphaerales bacterium]|jgi:membrane-bound serine protease (ClpP class)